MALASTLYQFDVRLSHVDRGVDKNLAIRTARHPSETSERLWLRLLAFCWQWEETISFGPGLGDPDEPDLLALRADGSTRSLIMRVGRPKLARIEKDCAQSAGARVAVLFESPRQLDAFLCEARVGRHERIASAEIAAVPEDLLKVLARREERRPKVGLTIVEDHFYVDADGENVDGALVRGRL
jgi:uncharacterized protein YaeQ